MAKSKSRKVGKKSRVQTSAQKKWMDLVSECLENGRKKNASYLLKDALKDASKINAEKKKKMN